MYVCKNIQFIPIRKVEVFGSNRTLVMDKEEKCCGNCLWFIDEDCLGDGWCYTNDCETSCDKVCKKHEF